MDTANGNTGDGSWGYEFDVQTRWAYYPAGTPNIIATFFAGRGLAEAGATFGVPAWLDRAQEAAAYVTASLADASDTNHPFFTYTRTNPRLVHNANLLGAGFVAGMGSLRGETDRLEMALKAAATTIADQREDGSWPYGRGGGLRWCDNFHTAYDLDGLLLLWLATGDDAVYRALSRGVVYWTEKFFGERGEPKYYPNRALPYDIHSAATAVDVASRLATWGFPTVRIARQVANWTRANLIDPGSGATWFQKRRFFVDRRNFIRWGDGHWALAQASLVLLESGCRSSWETAVHTATEARSLR
jgi:hypothetical protein